MPKNCPSSDLDLFIRILGENQGCFFSIGLFSEILSKIKSFKVIKEIEDGSQLAVALGRRMSRCVGSPNNFMPGRVCALVARINSGG